MIAKAACRLTTCLLLPLLIVCAGDAEIVRGQSPTGYAVGHPTPVQPRNAVYPVGYRIRGVRRAASAQQRRPSTIRQASASLPHGSAGQHQYGSRHGSHHGSVVSAEPYPGPTCQDGQCGHLGHGEVYQPGWQPTHRHFSTYDPPNNLVYPPAQVPAAVVQYPYYTVKGPSDFFMK